jgi:polar amino acid transport system permease protein/cystine transport system permease protein
VDFFGPLFAHLPVFLPVLLRGAVSTLVLTGLSAIVAFIGGLVLAVIRTARLPALSQAATVYIEVIRSIPVLASLFVIYFGLSEFGINLPSLVAAVAGLGMIGSAYMAENLRAGFLAIPKGQREAAASVGLSPVQAMAHVILPQAIRVAIPPAINYAIGLLKDTAIASTVAVPELLFAARGLVSHTILPLQVYFLTGLIYLAMSLPLAFLGRYFERRLAAGLLT